MEGLYTLSSSLVGTACCCTGGYGGRVAAVAGLRAGAAGGGGCVDSIESWSTRLGGECGRRRGEGEGRGRGRKGVGRRGGEEGGGSC